MKDKMFRALFIISLAVLILTFSIGLPIYFRPFYYLQIEGLGIPEDTGMSKEEIKEGYDEVLDYLTLPGKEFGTGKFSYSEDGKAHFADCKRLFNLNAIGFTVSLIVVILLSVLHRLGKIKLKERGKLPPSFFSGVGLVSVFALLGGIVSLDFDRAFEVFHAIFFPGKDNWLFNPFEDGIILAMPERFFMRCALLIASSIILISVFLIVRGVKSKRSK